MAKHNFSIHPLLALKGLARSLFMDTRATLAALQNLPDQIDGTLQAKDWPATPDLPSGESNEETPTPLEQYFDRNIEGPGIWKWRHYFSIYHRHLARFVGKEVHILEIGIYSGGSLGMWKSFFGDRCHVYGVDIEPVCKAYEADRIKVFSGDQSDRDFWKEFKSEVPKLDIVIDDGGHEVHQQVPTFEELFPHLQPGGVFLCEDLHGPLNQFAAYMRGLSAELNDGRFQAEGCIFEAAALQREIASIHTYPFITAIEKNIHAVTRFEAPKRGTVWQPFFNK